jgi:hypothetical protein
MAMIPENLHEHINAAYPENVCIVGTVQPGGWVQISPRGSVLVHDGDTLAYWDRGSGTTHDQVADGSLVTIFFRNPNIRELLPKGGVARFYGTASVHTEGPMRDEIYGKLIQPERDKDPDKKGRAVLLKLQRAENIAHDPLAD